MCLHITKITHRQVADKDILVFKMCYEHKGLHLSYFLDYSYQKGLYKSSIKKENAEKPYNEPYCYKISVALHSYEFDTMIIDCNKCYKIGWGANYNYYHNINEPDDLRVGLFIIPKGSTYYYKEGNYASNQLICTGEFYTIKKFLEKQEYL